MAYRVVPDRQGVINIGKLKENLVTEVELPAPGFGGGSYAVLLRRPKEDTAYPVSSRHEGNALIWTVQTADTAIAGTGKLECRWYGDKGEVAKSQTYMVRITDGLPDPTEAPEAWEGYIGQVARNAQAAQTAAGEAKANADGAAASAGIARGAATEAGKLARAAGDAANAAAAAASAASSAQTGAETARQNARAAAEAAETARSGAEAAKLAAGESATGAAGSAEAAAQAAQKGENLYNQVKADLAAGKLKGEKGEKGDPGKDAPQIDDAVISAENPWSSRKIVETLCPPIADSGNPVTCYPVAGYPLGVVASWEPTQAGTGDPSPENIRPIKGRDSVTVERCGANYIDILALPRRPLGSAIYISQSNGFRITTNAAGTYKTCLFYLPAKAVAGQTITFSALLIGTQGNALPGIRVIAYKNGYMQTAAYGEKSINAETKGKRFSLTTTFPAKVPDGSDGFAVNFYCTTGTSVSAGDYSEYGDVQIEISTAPTAYTPYQGDTLALALPGTVYGGDVDAVTGAGQETWGFCTLTGQEPYHIFSGRFYLDTPIAHAADDYDAGVCSHYKFMRYARGQIGISDRPIYTPNGDYTLDDDGALAWKSYLAAQYAAGTPVQIAYKLADPVAIQATGNWPLLPITGETNTIMSDADSVTVTGRADPIRIIQQLQAQLATATQQLDETQQAIVDTTAMTVDYIYQQDLEDIGVEEVDDSDNQTDTEPVDVPGV